MAAIAGNRKHGKMAYKPRNVVDENVFEAKDDGRAKNCVSQAGLRDGVFELRFPFVIAKRRFQ